MFNPATWRRYALKQQKQNKLRDGAWRLEYQELKRAISCVRTTIAACQGKAPETIKRMIRQSYLLRDMCVCLIEENYDIDKTACLMNKALQELTHTKIDFTRMCKRHLKHWERYPHLDEIGMITPKSILYSINDY